jgi:hypothetical protein
MSFAGIAVGVGLAVSGAAAIYGTTTQAGIAGQQLSMAQTTQAEQEYYNQQLMHLMQNPAAYLESPLFKSSLNVGLTGVAHQLGAASGPNSGMEAAGLLSYGSSFANNQVLQQESLLASLSGVTAPSSPSQSAGVASGAAATGTSSLSSLGGILAFLGSSGIAGGSSRFDPNYVNNYVANNGPLVETPVFGTP